MFSNQATAAHMEVLLLTCFTAVKKVAFEFIGQNCIKFYN